MLPESQHELEGVLRSRIAEVWTPRIRAPRAGAEKIRQLIAIIHARKLVEKVRIDTYSIPLEMHTRIRRRAVLSESAPPSLLSWPSGQTGVVEAGRRYDERKKPYPLYLCVCRG